MISRTAASLWAGKLSRGVGAALILPHVNIYAMNLHLKEIDTQVAQGAHAVVTLDGAGWHPQGDKLKVPDNISLLPLPPYSPELNPQENIWHFLRQNYWQTASTTPTPNWSMHAVRPGTPYRNSTADRFHCFK